jgi:hypothetical protein
MENTQELLQSICRKLNSGTRPLWKLEISDDEYKALKETLISDYKSNRLNSHKKLLVLYCAEWWRREYEGGQSHKGVRKNLEIPQPDKLRFNETVKQGLKALDLPYNDLRKQTHFRQGGFPLKFISGEKANKYIDILKKLLTDSINEFDTTKFDFGKLKDIKEVCYQIVNAVLYSEELPFDMEDQYLMNLKETLFAQKTEEIKKHKNTTIKTTWSFDNGQIKFQIGNLQEYYKFKSQVNRIEITIDNQKLALFESDEDKGEDCFHKINQYNNTFIWKGEQQIYIQSKYYGGEIENTFPSIMAPFYRPQVFVKDKGKWILDNTIPNTEKAVLFPKDDWLCEQKTETFDINGIEFAFAQFDDKIELKSTKDEETFYSKNENSNYYVDIRTPYIDWLEDANYNIITQKPNYNFFKVLCKDNDEQYDKFKILYRQQKQGGWFDYKSDSEIENGVVEFKIIFDGDGKSQIFQFFFIDSFDCKISNGTIEFLYDGDLNIGSLEQEYVDISKKTITDEEESNRTVFSVTRKGETAKIPETCEFTVKANNGYRKDLKIKTLCPIHTIMAIQNEVEIDYNEFIEESMLGYYKLLFVSENEVEIECCAFIEDNEKKITRTPLTFKKKIGSKGRKALDELFADEIEKLKALYDVNYLYSNNYIEIRIKDKILRIRNYSLYTKREGNNLIVKAISDDQTISYNARLYYVPVDVEQGIEVKELVKSEYTFILPEDKKFVVFSERGTELYIIPRFYDSEKENLTEEERCKNRENSIKQWAEHLALDDFQSNSWQAVLTYYDIVLQYKLPFATFNCFTAIAKSPELMLNFWLILILSDKKMFGEDDSVGRFENEFAVAFHWINKGVLCKKMQELLDTYSKEIEIDELANHFKHLLEMTLNCDAAIKEKIQKIIISGDTESLIKCFTRDEMIQLCDELRVYLSECQSHFVNVTHKNYFTLPSYEDKELANKLQTILFSPVKVAENIMGISSDLWYNGDKEKIKQNNKQLRRIINFYRVKTPNVYAKVLVNVINQINSNSEKYLQHELSSVL